MVAALFVLLMLPPLLALFGPRLFWPFVPRPGSADTVETGLWHRIAERVARRPGLIGGISVLVLVLLATGLLGTTIGMSQTEQFRVKATQWPDSTSSQHIFPAGWPTRPWSSPTPAGQAPCNRRSTRRPGWFPRPRRPVGDWEEQLVGRDRRRARIRAGIPNRCGAARFISSADSAALVGGSDAKALDIRDAATRDRMVVIPAILAVVLMVLYVLLRAVVAPLVLTAATVLSALAAPGLGGWASIHVFGFPGLDNSTPLFALLFLIALGVDYTIFLVTRAREEMANTAPAKGWCGRFPRRAV